MVKLHEGHPLKHWVRSFSKTLPVAKTGDDKLSFINEIINSQFNLITELKIKTRIIQSLSDIPEKTMPEKVLKSYLYMMIGNVTKSDNIIRSFLRAPPFENWKGYAKDHSPYHKLSRDNFEKIIGKLFNHPADRRIIELFALYLLNFYNEDHLVEVINEYKKDSIDSEALSLKFIEKIAPQFVHYLRFKQYGETRRIKNMRNFNRFPMREQSYWDWFFLDIDPLISDPLLSEFQWLESNNKLWFIYLMDNEKISDWYLAKAQRSYLSGKRQYLRTLLNDQNVFMLALYKIIQSGDIDASLIEATSKYLGHD
jgi:hypothetical protein